MAISNRYEFVMLLMSKTAIPTEIPMPETHPALTPRRASAMSPMSASSAR